MIFQAQTAFVGRAKEVYSSLSMIISHDFFKKTILDAYDVIPETQRLKFRHTNRGEKQTYIEFAQKLDRSFMNWLRSSQVDTFGELCQLMLVDDFLHKVPPSLRLYLKEREPKKLFQTATLAENYRLIQGDVSFRTG